MCWRFIFILFFRTCCHLALGNSIITNFIIRISRDWLSCCPSGGVSPDPVMGDDPVLFLHETYDHLRPSRGVWNIELWLKRKCTKYWLKMPNHLLVLKFEMVFDYHVTFLLYMIFRFSYHCHVNLYLMIIGIV